jgi:hypothetical protein
VSLWGDRYKRKEVKKWLNQLEAAAVLKAVTVVLVKAETVGILVGPTKRGMGTRLVHEIMPLQKAKTSN